MKKHLLRAIKASLEAGNEILKVYNSDFEVEFKEDESPLTLADKNSHRTIAKYIIPTPYPLLSEEGKHDSYDRRSNWDHLWIVDPLDGTKEFVSRNGEFTVNIALIKNGAPFLGVIYVPACKTLYFGMLGFGAYKTENIEYDGNKFNLDELISRSKKLPFEKTTDKYTVVGSRSHTSEESEEYFRQIKVEKGEVNIIPIGSSLKLCLLAEGKADEYPRLTDTMEWDIAAGHAILNASGFKVLQLDSDKELEYNKANLLNPHFIAK